MSEENIELFRRFNDAFNRGDLEGAIALVDPPPEFEFVPPGVFNPDLAAGQRGPEELRMWCDAGGLATDTHESLGRLAECAAGVARSASNLGKST
jgi:hypothetical protein